MLFVCLFLQDIGYEGEIGYQTFLYSNEPEIHSLLMFLVEKLPRESAEASDQPKGTENMFSHRIIKPVPLDVEFYTIQIISFCNT